MTHYAYSLSGDPQDYQGSFTSRRDARSAALEIARALPNPPATVFVGRIVAADPQITGHARTLLREMTRRADASGIGNYLTGVKVDQVAELDRDLAASIQNWLAKNTLQPKTFKIEAVSEYPMPLVPQIKPGPSDEVHDLGTSRTTRDL